MSISTNPDGNWKEYGGSVIITRDTTAEPVADVVAEKYGRYLAFILRAVGLVKKKRRWLTVEMMMEAHKRMEADIMREIEKSYFGESTLLKELRK